MRSGTPKSRMRAAARRNESLVLGAVAEVAAVSRILLAAHDDARQQAAVMKEAAAQRNQSQSECRQAYRETRRLQGELEDMQACVQKGAREHAEATSMMRTAATHSKDMLTEARTVMAGHTAEVAKLRADLKAAKLDEEEPLIIGLH